MSIAHAPSDAATARARPHWPHLDRVRAPRRGHWIALTTLIALCAGGGAAIGVVTNGGSSPWYAGLAKPAWNPPSWVFAPVWTTLYVAMAVAAWRVWRLGPGGLVRRALGLFLVQLACNFVWSPLFFSWRRPDLALADIVILWSLILVTIANFSRLDRVAARLLWPYLAWVTFATALNVAIVALN